MFDGPAVVGFFGAGGLDEEAVADADADVEVEGLGVGFLVAVAIDPESAGGAARLVAGLAGALGGIV